MWIAINDANYIVHDVRTKKACYFILYVHINFVLPVIYKEICIEIRKHVVRNVKFTT